MAAEQPSLRARARLNLGIELRLRDSRIGGRLPSGNRGEQEASLVLPILGDGGKASNSVKGWHLRRLIVGISEKFGIG